MGSITIRNIPDDVKQRFRELAAANGNSMEEELRQLLIRAISAKDQGKRQDMLQYFHDITRPGYDLPLPPDSPASHADFDE